ncbi:MAG: 3-methyl-2-oxobutanoate dehydrogenase subunit beta [Acidobacteriota bacterium]|jgi:ketoisovalerate ferredoxin oxidoreductase, beta subunit (EC 1.2.7.7)|nr:3-methyl-2-oxobutanoate dehydrogenase subunit beta [Acidobacteriota bacterium]OQB57627.1 MAG: Pyruvate synthase subunit PorB [Candidatus Aminicenantes bacterium ADurb.Bin147]HNQ80268.1 3-methyl-2-oxobutanoate dehydrogenase subunit beta [Candidatus Aminicenantes bacterium]MDD8029366.1 3-methyl-2-oxobutanoate dehydrogenase subunit beta [Acidobacteriota bacterium]MDD8033606.1 3-methyl-2-oxobutanoate dehydrogenase subunit beta [Acidobacteriota bacterium]
MSKQKKMTLTLPTEELVGSGNLACQGCGANLALRYVLKAFGKRTAICIPACCWAVIDGPFPYSCLGIPVYHCAFETAASTATGVKAGLEMIGDTETQVIAWAGDGGTFDIGIQSLSAAAERNDDILYVCYDNEAYMNTGIQRSSATPTGAWTTTTPVKFPKDQPKKDIDAIMAAHRIPYQATASIAYPEDLYKKAVKAKNIRGTKFIHVLAPCPTGWKSRPEDAVKLARLAVQTSYFPLYEVEDGEKYTLNFKIQNKKSIDEYLKLQGRFRHLKPEAIAAIQAEVDRNWDRLLKKVTAR